MRAICLLLAVAACTPEVASGSYLCGPEQLCPEGMACNGPDNTCVTDVIALPFACGTVSEVEPNNTALTAQDLGQPSCVSLPTMVKGCAAGNDVEDWYQLDVPSNCDLVNVQARATFPVAFEPLEIEVRAADDSVVATSVPCAPVGTEDLGQTQVCVTAGATPGGHYAVRIARAGRDNCDGACANNHYALVIQLARPML